MVKKLFLGICCCLFSTVIIAQTIRGRITDASNGAAVAAATIELENFALVVSDESGKFSFGRLREGEYTIRITSVGYRPIELSVSPNSEEHRIRLERFNLFMQPVEVRATRAGDRAPFTKTNIGKKEIEKMNLGQDLPFLLNQTPSVIINSDAGNGVGYTGIRIRGSDATRINMTINGIPYNDAESQGLFFVNLPDLASSVSNIQIQRGVGTSSNGAGAFGATINFSTNEVNTNPYAEISNSVGSFNTWKHTVKAGTGLLHDHFTIDARLSKISSDGYIDRASTDLKSFYLSAAYLTERTAIRVNVLSGTERTYQAWNGVSGSDLKTNRTINYAGMERPGTPYENETDNYQQDHYQLFLNHKVNPNMTFNTAFFLTQGKGYYEQYKAAQPFSDYGLPDFALNDDTLYETDLIRQLWLDNDYYGQVFSLNIKDASNDLTIGGGWNNYEGKHFGKIIWANAGVSDNYEWYNLPANKRDLNAYIKYARKIGNSLEVFGDIQYRNINYKIEGFRDNTTLQISNNYGFLNPKVGLSYNGNAHHVYASYSLANKEPNRDDFEAGLEQQPMPERLHDFEFGWEYKNASYLLGATIYYMLYKDQLVLTGKINDVGAYARTNIPDSYRMGIELQGKYNITRWLNAGANLALSRNRIKDFTEYFDDYDEGNQKSVNHGNTDISFSPAVVGGASINIFPLKNAEINLLSKYVSRQYLDNTSNRQRSLDPFFVQDIRMSYAITGKLLKQANIIFQVNNVFDNKYEPNGYTYSYISGGEMTTENYYFPMAGINYMVGLTLKF